MLNELLTPAGDGEVLLLPSADQLPATLQASRDRIAAMDFTVGGLPANDLRRQARAELAGQVDAALPSPWIATGHQSEMHHSGVWFKDAAAAAWAEATGGTALHAVADLDTISHVDLAVPRVAGDGLLALHAAQFAWPSGRQCPAQLPAPSAEAIAAITALGQTAGVLEAWAAAASSAAGSRTLAQWITTSRAAVNHSLGISLVDVYWSAMAHGRSFGRFAASICLDAERMFACHNDALTAHRAAHAISNPTQPVPDLHRVEGAVETPLWAFRGDGPREHLFVRCHDDGAQLLTTSGPLATLPRDDEAAVAAIAALAGEGIVIAPRALTLTMYLRAFVVDVFIHGTGGARYDLLGDELARRWFGWSPPPFATATATVRADVPRFDVSMDDLSEARWAAHHAWHNPYAACSCDHPPAEAARLRQRKVDALRRLKAAGRLSDERAAAFAEIHLINEQLRECLPAGQREAADRVSQVERQLAHNALADSRECFFALMNPDKLTDLIEKARRWASA